jgi:hypothetical protein
MKKKLYIVVILLGIGLNAFAQNFLWARQLGGADFDNGNSMAVDNAANVLTTGRFWGTADFDPGIGIFNLIATPGYNNVFVSKLDSVGNFVWAKKLGGNSTSWGNCIATDKMGNVYTTGFFHDTVDFDPGVGVFNLVSSVGADVFISKLDSSGNFVWAKKIGETASNAGQSIFIDSFGNIYTTGYFRGTVDFDPGVGIFNLVSLGWEDIFILKLDSSGNFIWAKHLGSVDEDHGYSIAGDPYGNVFTVGYFRDTADFDPGAGTFNLVSAGAVDIFVSKLDSSGNFKWAKSIGGSGDDNAWSVATDGLGNVYATGYFRDTVDFDPGAGTFNLIGDPASSVYILKLDSGGNFAWAKYLGTPDRVLGFSITTDILNNVYVTGIFVGTADFDPGSGVFNMSRSTGGSLFICKLNSAGNFIWATQFGDTLDTWGNAIKVDGAGNIYTSGWFSNTGDFDPGTGIYNLTSFGWRDIFVHKMGQSSTGIIENNSIDELKIFPNPTMSSFIISFQSRIMKGNIEISNILGETLFAENIFNESKKEINLKNITDGIYFVKLFDGEKYYCKKVIIERD